jgi:hypothetical protein
MSEIGVVITGDDIVETLREYTKVMHEMLKELTVISLELGSIRHILEKEDK